MSALGRTLRWDGCVNVRDLGGYTTNHGRPTRFGSVVRSDNPARLSPRGWQELRSYGVRTVIGLRTVGAVDDEPTDDQVPDDVEFVRVVVEDVTDREFADQPVRNGLWGTPLYFADALRRWPARAAAAVGAVAGAAPGGVVISCGRGCDRTGFLALLLLHLCGVSAADIASDYALSMEQMIERDPGYAEELTTLLERHGTSIERAISAVVAEPILETLTIGGLKAEELEALRDRLLEP